MIRESGVSLEVWLIGRKRRVERRPREEEESCEAGHVRVTKTVT